MTGRRNHTHAFTLVEVLISTSLAAATLAAVMSSFVFLGRTLTRLANYHTLEAKAQEAIGVFQRDLETAQAVKAGTAPTADTVTLLLPAGEVTYTYDSAAGSLRRQATFGANRDYRLLKNDHAGCTDFAFDYYTLTGGPPVSQFAAGVNVPYSIKQIQLRFTLRTPGTLAPEVRTTFSAASARLLLRNKLAPTGS